MPTVMVAAGFAVVLGRQVTLTLQHTIIHTSIPLNCCGMYRYQL
ncbi:hypothetical protein OH492_23215 [Vibrio chagasii]|nr:hypothetical protein [Vibrio chagasii]